MSSCSCVGSLVVGVLAGAQELSLLGERRERTGLGYCVRLYSSRVNFWRFFLCCFFFGFVRFWFEIAPCSSCIDMNIYYVCKIKRT